MIEKDIPDANIFMVLNNINTKAFNSLPQGFYFRNCKPSEINIWKSFPFDSEDLAKKYDDYMQEYFDKNYNPKANLFFQKCIFVCDTNGTPVATGFIWKQYDKYTTVHWVKTLKNFEGLGIGRALLTKILSEVPKSDYPIYLHTQPGSFRAIKLYSDFGFKLIMSPQEIDNRNNDIKFCLPILKEFMPKKCFDNLEETNL